MAGKSTLFALIKDELSIDAVHSVNPLTGKWLGLHKKPCIRKEKAIEYVIDGDREYRGLEEQLAKAEQADNGTLVAEIHGKIEAIGGYHQFIETAELLDGLGFRQEQMTWNLTQFSGGWRNAFELSASPSMSQ
ncbi:hypothetical protein AB6D62_023300 [Vibrio cyclitrophicus]